MKNFKWFFLMGQKFFEVVPTNTIFSVFLSLISKFTEILVSYLPLKIVILLGSAGIPKFFPASFQQFERETLVISLSAVTVVLYLIYLVSEKLLDKLNESGTKIILAKTRKMPLFENQSIIAQKGFQKYSHSLAEMFFLVLVIAILGWLYPSVLFLMVIYGLLTTVFLRFFPLDDNDDPIQEGSEHSKSMLIILFDVGFLFIFVFMIYQAINDNGPGILVMILTFILIRRFQASLKKVIVSIKYLVRWHDQLSALFFEEHVFVRNKKSFNDLLWELAEPSKVKQWAEIVIEHSTGKRPDELKCRWLQLDTPDILVYRVTTCNNGVQNNDYLIKLFGKKQSLVAQHEVELIQQVPDLPSLNLLAIENVQGLQCLLFEWQNGNVATVQESKKCRANLDKLLINMALQTSFVDKYLRSHSLLPQRLDRSFWSRLQKVSGSMEENIHDGVESLLGVTTEIDRRLNLLPLTVINHRVSPKMLLKTDKDTMLVLDWGHWSVEPMGAGLLTGDNSFDNLPTLIARVQDIHSDVKHEEVLNISLAAMMYSFEQIVNDRKFYQLYNLISAILVCLDRE